MLVRLILSFAISSEKLASIINEICVNAMQQPILPPPPTPQSMSPQVNVPK